MNDLVVAAGRKRQSSRTGFVHLFPNEEIADTIPIYENFCFAFALFRQKTMEGVTEGKELVGRLLAFQTAEGNFPVFLHDYPRCFDFQTSLKVAPILMGLLRLFGGVLGDLKPKIETALQKGLAKRPEKPFWLNRYRACVGEPLAPQVTADLSPLEWTDWLITAQLAGQTDFVLPYDADLQLFFTPVEIQERGEPQPNPIEWLLASGHYAPRLLRDHPHQLLAAPLFPISYTPEPFSPSSFRLLWKGTSVHSLVAKSLVFDLPEGVELNRNDLFEVALFTDISPETEVFINGKKATSFQIGDRVTIATPTKSVDLHFELTDGSGDFCGHIFRANRPAQVANRGTHQYEAYDWQIGLRTLRRSPRAQIRLHIKLI